MEGRGVVEEAGLLPAGLGVVEESEEEEGVAGVGLLLLFGIIPGS